MATMTSTMLKPRRVNARGERGEWRMRGVYAADAQGHHRQNAWCNERAARHCWRAALLRAVPTVRLSGYLQAGSPSPAVVTIGLAVLTPMPQENEAICVCVMVADQKPAPGTIVGLLTPVDGLNLSFVVS